MSKEKKSFLPFESSLSPEEEEIFKQKENPYHIQSERKREQQDIEKQYRKSIKLGFSLSPKEEEIFSQRDKPYIIQSEREQEQKYIETIYPIERQLIEAQKEVEKREYKQKQKKLLEDIKQEESGLQKKEVKKITVRLRKETPVIIPVELKKESEYKMLQILIEKQGCSQLFSALKNIRVLHKVSSSDSIIIFGILYYKRENIIRNVDIALKIVFKPINPLQNSLLVETQIYKNIISDLKYNDHTPHVVEYIGSYDKCKLPLHQLDLTSISEFNLELQKIKNTGQYDLNEVSVSITSKTSGKYLINNFDTQDNDNKLIIVFQILYTLLCFNNISLVHNDLHWENIFIDEYKHLKSYSYNVDDYIFTIKSRINTCIYDFDRSFVYHPAIERNFMNDDIVDTDFCKTSNQCNGINSKMDFQAFLGTLITFGLPIELYEWFKSITSESFRYKLKNRQYRQHLEGSPEINDSDLKPLDYSLKLLIKIMENKSFFSKGIDENKIIYKPHKKYKIIHDFTTSTLTHPSYAHVKKINISKIPSDSQFSNMFKNTLEIHNDVLAKLYIKEYYKLEYDIIKNAIFLFKQFYILKPIDDHIKKYIKVCFVMSLPFFNNIKQYNIKSALFKKLFKVSSYKEYSLIEDDIWNVFQGRLPIKFPILSYN